jgi:hypothetical protein
VVDGQVQISKPEIVAHQQLTVMGVQMSDGILRARRVNVSGS